MPERDTTPAASLCHCGLGTREGCATEPWGCGPASTDPGTTGRTETGATIPEPQVGGGGAGDSGADAHPPVHRWRVEHVDGNEWVPGSGLKADRDEAVHLLNVGNEIRPLWADGTPVQRRLIRETTSYTVEDALTPPEPGGHDGEGQ